MRVADRMRYETFKTSLVALQQKLTRSQEEVASGKRILHPSDDPVAAGRAVQITAERERNGQLSKNIEQLKLLGATYESALDNMDDLLTQAKQLAVTQASDTMDASSRKIASEEIKGIIEHLVTLGNTKVGNTYVFGGKKSNVAPFSLDETDYSVTFNGSSEVSQVFVEGEEKMKLGMSGKDAFNSNGADVFQVLKDLKDALDTNDATGIRNSLTGLDDSLDLTENNIASIGVYNSRIDTLTQNNSSRDTTYATTLSDMTDADIASVTADYNALSTAYQAVIYMMSKMQNLNILNYLT